MLVRLAPSPARWRATDRPRTGSYVDELRLELRLRRGVCRSSSRGPDPSDVGPDHRPYASKSGPALGGEVLVRSTDAPPPSTQCAGSDSQAAPGALRPER